MALPVSTITAADAYTSIRSLGRQMQVRAQQFAEQYATGSVYSSFVVEVLEAASDTLARVLVLKDVPGLGAYTRAQLGSDEIDLAPVLADALIALGGVLAAIMAEYPRNDAGFLMDRTFSADGRVQSIMLPATSLSQTASALDAFAATLD